MVDMNYHIIGLRHKPNNNIVFPMITSDVISKIKSTFTKNFQMCDMPHEVLINKHDYDIVLIGSFKSSNGRVIQDGFFNNKIISILDFENITFDKNLFNKKYPSNKKVGE